MERDVKQKFKYVFVILVYRNVQDLIECIDSIYSKVKSCSLIIVNSFYDDKSAKEIENVAISNNCVFLNVENKGYSYGNNVGIRYAQEHYLYDYIVISNPDITIKKFDDSLIDKFDIIAPKVVAASGKLQNPMVVKYSKTAKRFIYLGFKYNLLFILYLGILINKIQRTFSLHLNKNKAYFKIHAAHGSFMILNKETIEKLEPIFDENMFLFAEEDVLAYKARKSGISVYYLKDIEINHKEDGSMKLADFSTNAELRKSNIYFYEKYILGDYHK